MNSRHDPLLPAQPVQHCPPYGGGLVTGWKEGWMPCLSLKSVKSGWENRPL
jgi:hypothetical protein